jgi:hypothetical protein
MAGQANEAEIVPMLRSAFLMQISGEFEDCQEVGDTPFGIRRVLLMKRGLFSGPRLKGELLSGGDWLLARRDGIAQLDIRMTLRTDDGKLICVDSRGISDIAPEIRARIQRGENVDPFDYYFRTALMFETAAEKYRWLNRLVAVGVGRRTATGMATDVFAIR